jgi:hypothetical protein
MSAAFDRTLTALGPDPAAWSAVRRDVVRFRHTLYSKFYPTIPEAGTLLNANRGTYAMVVVLSNPQIRSESILSLGQSGFIQFEFPNIARFHAHFRDQLETYRRFEYKPMHLYRNRELKE